MAWTHLGLYVLSPQKDGSYKTEGPFAIENLSGNISFFDVSAKGFVVLSTQWQVAGTWREQLYTVPLP